MLVFVAFEIYLKQETIGYNLFVTLIFRWVQRDSYLPVGSQNLKAVTKVSVKL